MSSKAKIAVIGAGWWATTAHIPALLQNPRVELLAVVDKNPAALKAAADAYKLQYCYTSLGEALAAHPDLRGAVIAVPHAAHFAASKECLDHKLDILLEKPMVLTAKEGKGLIDLAKQKKREILVGYTYPYLEPVQEAKRIVDSGAIGDIEYVTCSMSSMVIEFLRGNPDAYKPLFNYPVTGPTTKTYSDPATAGGGQGHLQVTHSVGLMFYIAPIRAQMVTAFMNNLDAKVDVIDAMAVRMENGALATIGSTGNIGPGDGGIVEVHVHGSKGRVRVDVISGEMYMRLHDRTEKRIQVTNPPYPQNRPTERFLEMLLDGAPNPFPADTVGLHTVELLDAGYRSAAQNGMPVQVADLYR
jgi:predicted dehydrogenase